MGRIKTSAPETQSINACRENELYSSRQENNNTRLTYLDFTGDFVCILFYVNVLYYLDFESDMNV